MKPTVFTLLAAFTLGLAPVYAQSPTPGNNKKVSGQRKYTLFVSESDTTRMQQFNRGIDTLRAGMNNRGFLGDIASLYKSSAAGQAISLTTSLIDMGVNAIVGATRSKQPEWQKAVRGESTFVRRLPMQMEILDFYRERSTNGPLDPKDMNLNGFGCSQVIEIDDGTGTPRTQEVFYVSCKVRTDTEGQARMLNHSKFEVYIDSLRFDYSICDLPYDSIGLNPEDKIDFDFDKRNNLRFSVNAEITSSWINQAMMVYNDVPLGAFTVEAFIDPAKLDENGIFTYSSRNAADRNKNVKVSGECFLVPRSYVGAYNNGNVEDSWGTGQYKVVMTIKETCGINDSAYQNDKKQWDKSKWGPEWDKIKRRKKGKSVWKQIWETVSGQYKDSQWVTMLTEPVKSTFIQYEKDGVAKLLNTAPAAGASAPAGAGMKK